MGELGDLMPGKPDQSERQTPCDSHESPGVVKLIETDGRRVVARGWAEAEPEVDMGWFRVSVWENANNLQVDGCNGCTRR